MRFLHPFAKKGLISLIETFQQIENSAHKMHPCMTCSFAAGCMAAKNSNKRKVSAFNLGSQTSISRKYSTVKPLLTGLDF